MMYIDKFEIMGVSQPAFWIVTLNLSSTRDESIQKFCHWKVYEKHRLFFRRNNQKAELKADIRDMEGAAIVQVAYSAQLPVFSVKAISDVAGSGSTTEQYLKNRSAALLNLKSYLPKIFEEL